MNERIRELREQAWTLVSNEERDRGELYEAREQWERCDQKFAELIVRECAQRCEDIAIKHQVEETTYAAGKKAGAFECAEDIKEHFGVEE